MIYFDHRQIAQERITLRIDNHKQRCSRKLECIECMRNNKHVVKL